VDYEILGERVFLAVELDGFAFHSDRDQFTYDRFRQNDLHAAGLTVVRFSYDAIRFETRRCVEQLQRLLLQDPKLARYVIEDPIVRVPDDMDVDPLQVGARSAIGDAMSGYFDVAAAKINRVPLRECQSDALEALANYYGKGGDNAAVVMAVGAGKTALGVVACLGFAKRRAMIITPGSVIRGRTRTHRACGEIRRVRPTRGEAHHVRPVRRCHATARTMTGPADDQPPLPKPGGAGEARPIPEIMDEVMAALDGVRTPPDGYRRGP
jgi:hypothetical protein